MSDHARLSPSAAHRWMMCPGSVREEAKYPEEPSGKCAVDGTHSHTLLEHCLRNKVFNAHEYNGQTLKDQDGEFIVDQERSDRVNVALRYVREAGEIIYIPEEKIDPAHLVGRPDMKGTADIQIFHDGILEVIDYKDGMKDVSVVDNPQLEIYGLAALSKYKLPINSKEYPVSSIKLTIIQPKLALKGLPAISSVAFPVQWLIEQIGKYVSAAAATDDPNAPLKAGNHCGWCKHKGNCSEANNTSMEAIGFSPVQAVGNDMAQILANTDPSSLDNDRIVKIIEAEKLITGHIEAVKAEAFKRLSNGIAIPGLKLVNGRSSQEWSMSDDEIAERLGKMGVPKDFRYVTKVVSPAQAKKLKWEKKGVATSLSDRQIKTLETEYINKKSGNLTVALAADSRPAVSMDASVLFHPVQNTEPQPALPQWLMPQT